EFQSFRVSESQDFRALCSATLQPWNSGTLELCNSSLFPIPYLLFPIGCYSLLKRPSDVFNVRQMAPQLRQHPVGEAAELGIGTRRRVACVGFDGLPMRRGHRIHVGAVEGGAAQLPQLGTEA